MSSAFQDKNLYALHEGLQKGDFSSVELTNHFLSVIEAKDKDVNAFITVTAERALADAKDADARRAKGEARGMLDGIPGALKDNICTRGIRTTSASRMLENFVPAYSATVANKLAAAGMVLLGKLNMDEFAMGQASETSYFGPVKNPVDLTRVPGGSSGGSVAAVAAGEAAFTLGSDTGGSILQPAALTGVTGLRPTYGLVSRQGIVAFASSLDQAGPITKDTRDNAIVLAAIAGYDPRETTSAKRPAVDYLDGIDAGVAGLTFGLAKEYFVEGVAPEIQEAVLEMAKRLEVKGATIKQISLPSMRHGLATYVLITAAEASSNLARFDGIHYGFRPADVSDLEDIYFKSRTFGFGDEVKRRLMLGTFALSEHAYDQYYKKALLVREKITKEFNQELASLDAILAPVTPSTAWPLGEKITDPVQSYLNDAFTVSMGLAGLPALSLRIAKDEQGLPIGMQIIGKPFSERLLYQIGVAVEEVRG